MEYLKPPHALQDLVYSSVVRGLLRIEVAIWDNRTDAIEQTVVCMPVG